MAPTGLTTDLLVRYGVQLLGAAVIALAGALTARWTGTFLRGWLDRRGLDPPFRNLLVNAARGAILGLTLIAVLDKLGVQIAPLVAGLGVAGLGLGFALQDILGNLIAGLYITSMKPFRVGEYLELLGQQGQVASIDLLTTALVPPDASRIVIPNRKVVGEIFHSFGGARQLPLKVTITSSTDLDRALTTVQQVVRANPRVLRDPEPATSIDAIGDGVTFSVKPWVSLADWEPVQAELYRAIVEQLRWNGVAPFGAREARAA